MARHAQRHRWGAPTATSVPHLNPQRMLSPAEVVSMKMPVETFAGDLVEVRRVVWYAAVTHSRVGGDASGWVGIGLTPCVLGGPVTTTKPVSCVVRPPGSLA
jgi:hypothetical protein